MLSREEAFNRSGVAWALMALGAVTSVAVRVTGEEVAIAVFFAALMIACAVMVAVIVLYCMACAAMQLACFLLRRETPKQMPLMGVWDDKIPHGVKDALAVAALAVAAFALGMFVAFAVLMF